MGIAITSNPSEYISDEFTKMSKIGPSTESLNADFFQFLAKLSKILHKIVARNSSLTGDVSEDVSKFNKFPVASVSRTGDEAFFAYHVIT